VGPRTDVVGRWARAARAHGLRGVVSNLAAPAGHWYQPAYGYDAEGPLAGVRYDAARLTAADGRGTWWEGLDPQALYTGPHMPLPPGIATAAAARAWHDAHDGRWVETPPPGDPTYARRWLLRCNDLVDRYRPDFLYLDDYELPLGQAGLDAVAHFYNANARWHGGRLEAVVTAKQLAPAHRTAVVEDVERGFSDVLRPLPWQTDTCLGNWHYDRALFERHGYKSAHAVVQRLCDTVSKNGSLLLSVPIRGDGTIDADEEAILDDLGAWFAAYGPAVYGTRPWTTYGEGPTRVAAGMQNEGQGAAFTAADVRFTTRGDTLYAILLDWPAGRTVTLRSLADGSPHGRGAAVARVGLAAGGGPRAHRRDADGRPVTLPERRPGGAVRVHALALSGRGLVAR
jgi:alpha-L-fucosidase